MSACVCVFSAQSPMGVSINKKVSNIFEVVQSSTWGAQGFGAFIFPHAAASLPCFFFFLSDTHLLYEVAVLSVISK